MQIPIEHNPASSRRSAGACVLVALARSVYVRGPAASRSARLSCAATCIACERQLLVISESASRASSTSSCVFNRSPPPFSSDANHAHALRVQTGAGRFRREKPRRGNGASTRCACWQTSASAAGNLCNKPATCRALRGGPLPCGPLLLRPAMRWAQ